MKYNHWWTDNWASLHFSCQKILMNVSLIGYLLLMWYSYINVMFLLARNAKRLWIGASKIPMQNYLKSLHTLVTKNVIVNEGLHIYLTTITTTFFSEIKPDVLNEHNGSSKLNIFWTMSLTYCLKQWSDYWFYEKDCIHSILTPWIESGSFNSDPAPEFGEEFHFHWIFAPDDKRCKHTGN